VSGSCTTPDAVTDLPPLKGPMFLNFRGSAVCWAKTPVPSKHSITINRFLMIKRVNGNQYRKNNAKADAVDGQVKKTTDNILFYRRLKSNNFNIGMKLT
jgi:hypothetical protein